MTVIGTAPSMAAVGIVLAASETTTACHIVIGAGPLLDTAFTMISAVGRRAHPCNPETAGLGRSGEGL